MVDTILAEKLNMVQAYVGDTRVPVTVVQAGPCPVTQVKTEDHDGYWAIQLGFGNKRTKNTSKALQGHFKKAQTSKVKEQPRFFREVRLNDEPEEKVGDYVSVADIFVTGDLVQVTGTSKGKGFAGGMKRHGFGGGPRTHGQSDRPRSPGSIGQGTTPGRVHKGKRMAGRMGTDTVTVKNLKVVSVDYETGKLELSGPVPGIPGSLVVIKRLSEKQERPVDQVEVQETQEETKE